MWLFPEEFAQNRPLVATSLPPLESYAYFYSVTLLGKLQKLPK
jgi:hypothetical protein